MQSDQELFNRRRFLEWSAAGAAAASAQSLFSKASAQEPQPSGERQAPAHPITLRSSELELILDSGSGLPYEYRLLKNNARLRGEDFGLPIAVTLCRRQPWSFTTSALTPESHDVTHASAIFHFHAVYGDTAAAQFSLGYALRAATLLVTLEKVEEQSGFELIDVSIPRLVTVRESDESAWLAHGDQGGSLAMLSAATAGTLPPNTFWGNVLGTLPVVMVGTAHALCVQETTAFMDGTTLSVVGSAGKRRASIGTDKVHRVNGGACYDLNLGRGKPRNCGNQGTPNLLVEQLSSCRLDFLPVTGEPEKAWIAAGKLVRGRMPKIPTNFYNDKYVYGIRCDEPLYPQPSATFEQCGEIISRVAALIDHSPQIVHLWGWQFQGKDTGYPAVNVVNERIGGYDGMMRLMDHGPALNATVTLSDNYDDAYRSSPAWSDALVARRPDGQLWKSRSWTGEESYILGLAKYMDGPGPERVRYTCERYQLQHTTHIDVLSYYSVRNDWDPEHPASGIRNLIDGRYKVLAGFAVHGVDVSSEALRYPMIGHISCYWYLTGPTSCPFGGTHIPLVPLIYGNSAVWGLSGAGAHGDPATVRILERFFGACPHSILRADSDTALFLDAFYLGVVPFFLLRGRSVEDFERNGDATRIHLEGGALIESNLAAKTLRIAVNGVDVLRDDSVFGPIGDEKIACYSITPRTVSVPLPSGWSVAEVTAVSLYPERRVEATIEKQAGSVNIALEARRPVILYRNKADAQLH
jgi:Endo-alpha-N-acetylgalactosaminidase